MIMRDQLLKKNLVETNYVIPPLHGADGLIGKVAVVSAKRKVKGYRYEEGNVLKVMCLRKHAVPIDPWVHPLRRENA